MQHTAIQLTCNFFVQQDLFCTQHAGCNALREKHNGKSYEISIWGEGYTKGSHGFERSQHKAAFVAHTGEETKKLDIAESPICADKEREGGVCRCCAAVENPYSLCWPIEKKSPCRWESGRIEIS